MRFSAIRFPALALTAALLLGFAGVALAQDEEEAAADESAAEATDEAGEEGEPGFLASYGNDVKTKFLGGTNGVITSFADPVALAVNPTDDMKAMPGGVVTGPVTGFFGGLLLGTYRLASGALDQVLAPFYIFPMLSPEPRYKLIPGWEHPG
jgi:hypothetical protein